jgi:Na+/H+-dicarboxylate symporter
MKKTFIQSSSWKYASYFALAIVLGILNGLYPTQPGLTIAQFLSDVFVRLFKFISVPIIAVTICYTIARLGSAHTQKALWKRTLGYTLTTTLIAAGVGAALYYFFTPAHVTAVPSADTGLAAQKGYLDYFVSVIPDNPLAPLVQGNVLSVLIIAIVVGIAIRYIQEDQPRATILNVLGAVQSILFSIVSVLIRILPLGIFGFTSICTRDFAGGVALNGLGHYFVLVVSSNLIQGFIVLPLFLLMRQINPLRTAKNMSKALLVAFFSKSSAGTLPVTMACAEKNNKVNPTVSRFVLPICTTINMNGCASFILITVIFLMQNNGIVITIPTLLTWVVIATVAAIGNAGVPMGCYFLSASLLSSMNVPIQLLGIILPFYTVLDMVETSLNVWSDSCVATLVNKDLGKNL